MAKTFDVKRYSAEYNNRTLVPEHAQHFAEWASCSDAARGKNSRRLDVRYGAGDKETLDIFPSTRANSPVLVFIHGGWFRALDKAEHAMLAPAFTKQGACVVLTNYPLCPAATVQQIVMTQVRALAWVWRNIALYGGDARRITVVGHSAGGHLAAMMALCDWRGYSHDLPAKLVKAAVSISGVHELQTVRRTPFLNGDLHLTPAWARKLSPALMPAPKVPVHCLVGSNESAAFLEHNALLRKAWGKRAVPTCEELAGLNHFSVLETMTQPGSRLHEVVSGALFN